MLLRISLIVAIIAGLAVGGLNFVMVKDKVVTLANDRDNERGLKDKALGELATTKKKLSDTTAALEHTRKDLADMTSEKEKVQADLDAQTKVVAKLTDDLKKTAKDLDDAKSELAAYAASGLTPPQVVAIDKQYRELQKAMEALEGENKLLAQKIQRLENELAIYKVKDYVVPLPAGLAGKVIASDPKWNFVILDVGQNQGVLEYGELLVNRNGKLVAMVRVRTVRKDSCVANVMPGWQIGEVIEGDQVIPAHPAS